MTGPGGYQPGAGRLRGPDPPAAPGWRRTGAELGQDRDGVSMPFGEPGQGEIFLRQPGQDSPALTCLAATRQRQVQPARPDRVGKGRSGGGAGPRTGVFITTKRTRRGERPARTDHFHPLGSSRAARRRTGQTSGAAPRAAESPGRGLGPRTAASPERHAAHFPSRAGVPS
jgi:hypothetical protein